MTSDFAQHRQAVRLLLAERPQLPSHVALPVPQKPKSCTTCQGRGSIANRTWMGVFDRFCMDCMGRGIQLSGPMHELGEAAAEIFGHWQKITCPACAGRGRCPRASGLFRFTSTCMGCIGRGYQWYPYGDLLVPTTGLRDADEGVRELS